MSDSSDKGVLQRLAGLVIEFYDWLEEALSDPLVRPTSLINLAGRVVERREHDRHLRLAVVTVN